MIVTCVLGGTTLKNTTVLLKREIVLKLTEGFLMFHKPAHKQIGPNGPGQVVNDITLGDYLERKYPEETKKKLTFEEWWNEVVYTGRPRRLEFNASEEAARLIWKAAQENV